MDKLLSFARRLICAGCVDLSNNLKKENKFLKAQVSYYQETRRYYVAAAAFGAVVAVAFIGWTL